MPEGVCLCWPCQRANRVGAETLRRLCCRHPDRATTRLALLQRSPERVAPGGSFHEPPRRDFNARKESKCAHDFAEGNSAREPLTTSDRAD
jgi:hypothetical protein